MCSTLSDQLYRRPEDQIENSSFLLSVDVAAEGFIKLTSEIAGLLLQLNDYKEMKENLECRVSEQGIIAKVITASAK